MAQPPRLKRQILQQAVDENLSTIEGRAAPQQVAAAPPGRRREQGSWVLPLLLFGCAAIGLGYVATNREIDRATSPASDSLAAENLSDSASKAQLDLTSQLTFPAPRAIDPSVFPLEVRQIVLDPGHGGDDHGTIAGDLAEKNLTLDIAQTLRKKLEVEGFSIVMTREEDRWISLKERADFANQRQADLFVSIHINWLSTRQVRGIETYFLGPTEDPDLIALARRENHQSGYSLGEMKPLLERLYTDFLNEQSRNLAAKVQRSLFTSLLRVNPDLKDRGVKTAPFVVLVSTEMPAILAEVSCLSNQEEAELLSRPLYREHIADALARGIRKYAEDVNQTEEKGT